jgi:diacylglycerol diphosphate phosphatase / phosphatidate phosphatase
LKLIEEGRKSWPSGHASLSFDGHGFLAPWIWFHAKLDGQKWKVVMNLVCVVPFFVAAFVSVTRIRQNVHSASDVVPGAVIGVILAAVYFFHHFH